MATSGLVSAIHCLDFSKPANTRFQYGSSVCLLSIAAPMAGTCDEEIPAMIFATGHFRFFEDLDLAFGFALFFALFALALLAFLAAGCCYLPDLERLPSTERPPASIILA